VTPAPSAPASERSLEEIVRLADQGRLAEADRQAREFLERHGPSVAAFHALGLISDASNRAHDAAMYYRKVLYLDPNHHETLVHLALTLEQLGDATSAELFRDRARRVQAREKRP
jgi:chemotaxis protein methyltransferase WspC